MTLGAVSDAGPLIHLAEIDSLELLSAFDMLLIPETVDDGIKRGGIPDGSLTSRVNSSRRTKIESSLKSWMLENAPRLRSRKRGESFS